MEPRVSRAFNILKGYSRNKNGKVLNMELFKRSFDLNQGEFFKLLGALETAGIKIDVFGPNLTIYCYDKENDGLIAEE